jgi:triosephosphate isomerase
MFVKRTPFVAGNWKMNKTVAEARQLVSELVPGLQKVNGVEKVLCPPFNALLAVRALLEGTDIGLGAQNMYWESNGAFTGEVAPPMIAELCRYVIIGHSERRAFFQETDETVNRKLRAALAHGITPIVCVGETLEEKEAGLTSQVVIRQVKEGLAGIELDNSGSLGRTPGIQDVPIVVAYEPVWAIGTGRAATADGANTVVGEFIRSAMAELYGEAIAKCIRVLYGGSVKANNAKEFFDQPEIDGALVGGACLNAEEFISIVYSANR